MMRSGGLVLPHRRYSMPETVMRKYRLRQRAESLTSDSSSEGGEGRRRRAVRGGVDRGSQTSPRDSWRSFPSLATPSPRALSSALTSDCQTVSDKTVSTQDSTLSVPSTNSDPSLQPTPREDVQTQVSLKDGTTSVLALKREYPDLELAVNIEAEIPEVMVPKVTKQKDESVQVNDAAPRSIACQADDYPRFQVPDINVFKDSVESQLSLTQTKEESSQVSRKEIMQEMDPLGYHVRRMRAEVACTRTNYDDYPIEKPVVPRYSAVPRTNSMMVNTSSVEFFSSDSELSLTDSLEDPEDYKIQPCRRRVTRHDERPVRGEVALEQERRKLPKSRDAYAYFVSLTGEEDTIREYSVPDWLRDRLRRREEEIKKIYEDKLSRHQQIGYFRRRKKTVKRIKQRTPYSSSDKIKKNEIVISDSHPKNEKTVHFDTYGANNINNTNVHPSTSDKCAVRLINSNNMVVEPKIDNIHRNNHIQNAIHNNTNNHNNNNNNNNGGNSSQLFIQSETANRNMSDTNLVQISEIIKIEMSDNSRTVITKEKQINLPGDTKVQQIGNETVKNELSNSTKIVSSKTDGTNITAELVETNVLNTFRESNALSEENGKKSNEAVPRKSEFKETPKERREHKQTSDEDRTVSNHKFKDASKTVIQKAENNSNISLDRKIADILINALEENTKAHQMCGKSGAEKSTGSKTEASIESTSKIYVRHDSGKIEKKSDVEEEKSTSIGIQTEDLDSKSDRPDECKLVDKSCITEPYLVSVRIQTSDQDCDDQEEVESEYGHYEEDDNNNQQDEAVTSFESVTIGNVKMVDKACNTVESASISTQTTESILQSEDILNGFKKSKSAKKKEVQFPPQVIKQIITGTGEYKTIDQTVGRSKEKDRGRSGKRVKVSKGTNTEEESVAENNKNIINNNNIEIMSNRGHPTPFCKNVFPSKEQQKKTQVLELNVPKCTCHMCTLQKISPRAETSKSKIPHSKKQQEEPIDEKKTSSKVTGRRNMGTKFQMFEVIPEEKTSSNESVPEERIREDYKEPIRKEEKGVLTGPYLVDQVVQVGSHIANVATNTEPPEGSESDQDKGVGTQTDGTRWESESEVDKAVGTQTEVKKGESHRKSSNLVIGRFRSESPLLMRQYKGRASISAGHQEELLNLSKGWINFYLLNDNFDLSDNDQPCSVGGGSRRRTEDKVEEYTLEIQATPEPRGGLLPNLRQSGGPGTSGVPGLPEIVSSSPSPTAEEQHRKGSRQLPGVRKTRRLDVKREAVLTQRRDPQQTTRTVEVARSEQSISSITSSTVIMSESPPPQQHKLPERKSSQRRAHRSLHLNNGSSWTVTVAGSSGSGNDPPPDVEMKLSFAKQGKKQEDNVLQYQVARPKRQGRMIEEFSHVTRNEKHAVQCVQDLSVHAHHAKSSLERTRGGTAKDNFSYEEDYINRLSSRSKYSTEDGSELAPGLHVTGLAITPEKKPRVPTQSERDILRPQRYNKFTR